MAPSPSGRRPTRRDRLDGRSDRFPGLACHASSSCPAQSAHRSAAATMEGHGAWRLITSVNQSIIASLSEFEQALDEDSLLSQLVRPATQIVITGWLGAGNERVYRGREGWLFYRPDVEYITGRPFLDPVQIARRAREAPVSAPDPQ